MAQWVVSLSLRNGFIRTSLTATLALFERAVEAVRLGAGFDEMCSMNYYLLSTKPVLSGSLASRLEVGRDC
jgi:hypothetical protein